MQLLTEELKKQLPPLYSTEEMQDPQVICRYFLPMTNMEWFVTEFDGKETFFGYVVGDYLELGYFSLDELRLARGPFGLEVERDRFFSPLPLSKMKAEMKAEIKGGHYATL